jgi:hypothetical protein
MTTSHATPVRRLAPAAATALLLACGAPRAAAQPPAAQSPAPARPVPPDVPSTPHERLTFFEGAWTVADLPPERRYRETCAWMEGGRRHMICRTRSLAQSGQWRESISMFSYRAADSTYLYYGLRSGGAVEALLGRPTADGWQFSGDRGVGPGRQRVEVTIARLAAGRFRLVERVADGDGPFGAADTVHYVPAPKAP